MACRKTRSVFYDLLNKHRVFKPPFASYRVFKIKNNLKYLISKLLEILLTNFVYIFYVRDKKILNI